MKFENADEAILFLYECGREDLAPGVTADFKPSEELLEAFISRRQKTVSHLKDFRRQQISRQQWRTNRYEMMRGIKTFHRSTKGKKFHRTMGRFLATRMPISGSGSLLSLRNIGESYFGELGEVFKGLSSFETHAWIQLENYMTQSETADYEIFLEEASRSIVRVKEALMSPKSEVQASDVDFLLASLNQNCFLDASQISETDFSATQENFVSLLKMHEKAEFPYIAALTDLQKT